MHNNNNSIKKKGEKEKDEVKIAINSIKHLSA